MALEQTTAPVAGATLGIPGGVAGPVDIGRLIRELDAIDNAMTQSELRGDAEVKTPKTSRLMDQTLSLNKVNLTVAADRKKLAQFLVHIRDKSPVLHISFSTDPSPLFLEKLMTWLRRELDPNLLLTVGMQPNIGAGCVVRTTNKYFDMSLRKDFMSKRALLVAEMAKMAPKVAAPAPVVATPAPVAQGAAA
jgi:hypothetical protein